MESQKDINESTEAPSEKEVTPESEFNRLISSNEKAEKLATVFNHKFKQLTGRYSELSGKMNLKLNGAEKTVI